VKAIDTEIMACDTTDAETVASRYDRALHQYLADHDELALLSGYEIGRTALADGLGVLDIASIHLQAVANTPNGALEAGNAFFMEVLSPFEMARRAFRDANATLRRVNEMLEAQAKRIAYALHSDAGQLLASVHFALAEADRDTPAGKSPHLARVRDLLGEIESRLRNLSHELRPAVLENLGLARALDVLAEGVLSRWGLPVKVSVCLEGDLPASIEGALYSIAQEALTNAAKHADATHAIVRLRQGTHSITCSISDDGAGFDDTAALRKAGLGLTEIRERVAALGGVVRVNLNGGRGTDLTVEIPLNT
jgi:signal transduction histidine kinase